MGELLNPAGRAVNDAIETTQKRLVKRYSILFPEEYQQYLDEENYDLILSLATPGKCHLSSVMSLHHIAHKYPDQFSKMAIITTSDQQNPSGRKLRWTEHSYFIAQGIMSEWYAASPANYQISQPDYVKPIIDSNIEAVLKEIEEREGGNWPNIDNIQQAFRRYPRLPRTNAREIFDLLHVERSYADDYPISVNHIFTKQYITALPNETGDTLF